MNQEIKEKWLEALRSGDYEQGKYCLSSEGKYCCLGVLCDIAIKEGVTIKTETKPQDADEDPRKYKLFDGQKSYLPGSVMNWAGLESQDPTIEDNDLSEHNDDYEKDFKKIADLIEKHL